MHQETYDLLCEKCPACDDETCAAAAGDETFGALPGISPSWWFLAELIAETVWGQLQKIGCPNKEAIVAAAKKYVADRVSNPVAQALCNRFIDFAAKTACPV